MAQDSAVDDGTQEEATSESSKQQSGQHSSSTETITVEQFRALQGQLTALQRSIQGDKDRAVKKTNQRLEGLENSLKEVLQTAKREGKSIDEVLDEVNHQETVETQNMLREMAIAWRAGQFPQKDLRGSESESGVDVSEVLSELELDDSDVRVKEFRSRAFKSKDEAWRDAAKLVKSMTKQPSDADKSEVEGKRPAPASNQDKLMQEYREGSKNLYGLALTKYKQKMREKGLEIS